MVSRTWTLGLRSLRRAVLPRTLEARHVLVEPDFGCLEIPDEFVGGYGLEYRDAYRNLSLPAALEQRDMSGTVR
ncbi:MAG: hypothetical protein ACODAD_01640 [Planctomycetota bacterium]